MKLFIESIQYHPDSLTFQNGLYKIIEREFIFEFLSILGINNVINSFQSTLLSIDNLIPDTTFDNFTRPYINEKYEEKLCGRIIFFLIKRIFILKIARRGTRSS
jgi:hypothetical protein